MAFTLHSLYQNPDLVHIQQTYCAQSNFSFGVVLLVMASLHYLVHLPLEQSSLIHPGIYRGACA